MSRKTMYMHTIDKHPARLVRFTRGRVAMIPATPGVRLPLFASLSEIRQQWNECGDDAFAESMREKPDDDINVHNYAAREMLGRLGYVLVEVHP